MTADAVLPLVTAEWQTTADIARALYDAEGRRGTWPSAQRRAWRGLKRLESQGRVDHRPVEGSFEWRLSDERVRRAPLPDP